MNFVISEELKPCMVCGSSTNKIDICTESRICSDKCMKVSDNEYMDYINRLGDDDND